ncbi:hypothetical protein [Paucibacter soli]|uniref:hypothetical protein n=1 Tax=Paucibacter soli TaxID=3133433 RepID=UPI0030B0C81C
MSAVTHIAGTISHISAHSWDEHLNTFSVVELQTAHGLVILKNVVVPRICDPVMKIGGDVVLATTSPEGPAEKFMVWAVRDLDQGVTYADKSLFVVRDGAVAQAFLFSLMSLIVIPVGLVLFVLPGVQAINALWKTWRRALAVPTVGQIESAVQAMELFQVPVMALVA